MSQLQLLFANDAISTLAGPISTTATAMSVAAGTGILFPQPTTGQTFSVTLVKAGAPTVYEIVYVTAVSTDTFTIVRAQEGTAAQTWNAGDTVDHRITAGWFNALRQNVTFAATWTTSGSWTVPQSGLYVIEGWGGGGGGGGGASSSCAATGGAGAGRFKGVYYLTQGTVIPYTIGSGGTGGVAGGGNGTAGGATSIGNSTIFPGGTPTANGGSAGIGSTSGINTTPVSGGTASGGTIANDTGFGALWGYQLGGSLYTGGLGGGAGPSFAPSNLSVGGYGFAGLYPGQGGQGASANAAGGAGFRGQINVSSY